MTIQEISLPFDIELPPVKMLTAGALTCMYETGNLRYIRLGGIEVVRKIYGAVRDENWETIPYAIKDEEVSLREGGFTIRYTAIFGQHTPIYKADYQIEGRPDNSIVFSMKGEALATFQKNRIGLCVHHPVKECRGKPVTITQPDGRQYQSAFPDLVNPVQPFLQVRQMQWSTGNVTTQLLFEGDVFETEDQRNWSDSSFKTYSTPQEIPFPAGVKTGDTIEQVIRLKVSGTALDAPAAGQNEVREEACPFPRIGYSRSTGQLPLTAEPDLAGKIPFDHYRLSLLLSKPGWLQELQVALAEARLIKTRLELVAFFSDAFAEELNLLLGALMEQWLVRSILVLHEKEAVTPAALLEHVYPLIKAKLPNVHVGYGTDSFFADVNRNRPGQTPCDFISFSLHPQVHATDTRSVLENLQSQAELVKTAIAFSPGKPICLSPVTLKDRHSQSPADERQYSSVAALWTLISLQNLSAASSITFYELFGRAGILANQHDEAGSMKASPVYQVLSIIHQFRPSRIIKRWIGPELMMDGLLLENEAGERLFFKAPAEATGLFIQ